ncbi:MAG: nucleotide exchange factor GrpE [Cyanobacteria bacterium P01_F01_bin.42]
MALHSVDFTDALRHLMTEANISSFRQLSQVSRVPRSQILRIRRGELERIPLGSFTALATALKVPVQQILELLQVVEVRDEVDADDGRQQWERDGLDCLESLITQLPTAAAAARKNEAAPAFRLLPLLSPLDRLLEAWNVTAIAQVGDEVDFNPQYHQWNGTSTVPEKGEKVRVSHVGYFHGDRLLHRAKVKSI